MLVDFREKFVHVVGDEKQNTYIYSHIYNTHMYIYITYTYTYIYTYMNRDCESIKKILNGTQSGKSEAIFGHGVSVCPCTKESMK